MHTFIEQLIQSARLDAASARQLWQLSGLHEPPERLGQRLEQGLALAAAALLGAGVIFFVAANWQAQSRGFKLVLLQAGVLLPVLAACVQARGRGALLLLATLALGALLAFVGQTYQTGADAWQLFALWALLALPWAVLARADWLWAAWLLVAGTGIVAWSGLPFDVQIFGGHRAETAMMRFVRLALWALLFLWPLLARALRLVDPPRVRASWAVAALLALSVWVGGGLGALFGHDGGAFYGISLLLVLGAFVLAWRVAPRDYVVLALALMSVNAMGLGLLAKGIFSGGGSGDWLGRLTVFTLITAAAVGASGTWLYRLQRGEARA